MMIITAGTATTTTGALGPAGMVGELHSRLDAVGLRLAVAHVRLDAAYRVAQAACALPLGARRARGAALLTCSPRSSSWPCEPSSSRWATELPVPPPY